jgi:hypothetical protein
MKNFAMAAALSGLLMAVQAHAAVGVYADKAAYMAASASTQATVPYFDGGYYYSGGSFIGSFSSYTSGSVTFTAVGSSGLYFGDFTTHLPGGEISMNSVESVDLAFAAPVMAFGFDFVEPALEPHGGTPTPFVDSTFTVTLRQGNTTVGSFTFNAPNDQAAFVGATSTLAFNNVQIRETVGAAEDEYYGQFYTSATLPVPEPAGWALWLAGAAAGAVVTRRQRLHLHQRRG